MTLKKSSRAGLVALAFGILLGLFLSVASFDASYAQAQAPAAAPAAAPPAPAAPPPACANDPDPKKAVLEKCTPNSGDTAWMLTSVALVLMMTIPGLGLFYGGMVRKKNVGDTVMTSFAVTCLVTILFALFTYSMAFRAGSPFIGGLDRMFLKDILSDIGKGGIGNPNPLAATIPESVYICFQMTFAIITPALIAGAFAERMMPRERNSAKMSRYSRSSSPAGDELSGPVMTPPVLLISEHGSASRSRRSAPAGS